MPSVRLASMRMLVSSEQACGAFDVGLTRQEGIFKRRRVRHRRIECAHDANRCVEPLERFFLDARSDGLTDTARARVFVNDQYTAGSARYVEDGLAIERDEGSQIEHCGFNV